MIVNLLNDSNIQKKNPIFCQITPTSYLNRLCLNVAKSKFMAFHMPQKIIPNLTFNFNVVQIEQVNEFNFTGLLIHCNLNSKAHLHMVSTVATDIHVRPLSSTHTTINPMQRLGS